MGTTMALPRWELTAQTPPGSWGGKGRGAAGLGQVCLWDRDGWEGIPDRPASLPHPSCGHWLPCPETSKEAGSTVASFGTPWSATQEVLRAGPLPSPMSRLLAPGRGPPAAAPLSLSPWPWAAHTRGSGFHTQPVLCRGVRSFGGYRVTHAPRPL